MDSRKTNELKPHELNAKIYGDSFDNALLESIKAHGVLNPLIITADNVIVSGHRRHAVAAKIGLEVVPVFVCELVDELDVREAIIENNRQREKTTEQRAREFGELQLIEEKRAADRKRRGVKTDLPLNSTDGESKGDSRDIAAKKVGMGWQRAEKAAAVVKVIDTLTAEEKWGDADLYREKLNKSVSGAFELAKDSKLIPRNEAKKIEGDKRKRDSNEVEEIETENNIKLAQYAVTSFNEWIRGNERILKEIGGIELVREWRVKLMDIIKQYKEGNKVAKK